MTRKIAAVEFTAVRARVVAAILATEGYENVRVHREKIRAESTWRWGWVIVVDAREGD